jgi:3-phenylpropionate/trans-cinnamate dioxygenase ferredoxin reductase subunit
MANEHVDHLLIGGGIAAASCAKALREAGAEGSIVLLGRELDAPYHRPPATKGYLQGHEDMDSALVHPESWWEENGVELRTRTNVRSIDTEAKTVEVMKSDPITYGTCLVATGAMVRRLKVDGDNLKGLHYVRALRNADAVRRDAENAEKVVLVGGSYIGCEVAASLTALGKQCTIVMQEDEPMERGFGPAVGAWVRRLLESKGVEVLGGVTVERFEGDDEQVQRVVLGDRTLDCDLAVLGTGATPDVMLAKQSGLEIGETGGVKCSSRLETSAPGVYAAGDMCEYDSVLHGRPVRIEHEDVAASQGRTVAANMLGGEQDHTTVPYFWTDLADWATIEYVGAASSWDEERVRGSLDDDAFSMLYLSGGRLVACTSVGRPDDLRAATDLLAGGGDLSGSPLDTD